MAIAAALCITSVAARADEDAATVAFNDALELVERAQRTPSPAERWTLYETAHSYMKQITEVFPGSDLAHRMGRDETVDGARFAYVKRELLRTGNAVCDRSFTAKCALRVAFNAARIAYLPHPGDIYLEIGRARAAVGDIDGAFATIEVASSEDFSAAIPAIMAAMVRSGDLDGAFAKAKAFHRARDRSAAMLSIVGTLARAGDFADGERIAARIAVAGDRDRALATVARARDSALAKAAWARDHPRPPVAAASPDADALTAPVAEDVRRAETVALARAHERASRIGGNREREKALIKIARDEAAIGDFDAAVKTAHSLRIVSNRAEALRAIAAAHLGRGRGGAAKALLHDAFRGMFGAAGILRDVEGQIYMPVLEAFKNIGTQLARIEASPVANVP